MVCEAKILITYEDVADLLIQFLDTYARKYGKPNIVHIPKASNFWLPILERYSNPTNSDRILLFDVIYDTGKTINEWKKKYPDADVLVLLTKKVMPGMYHIYTIPQSLHDKWFFGLGLDLFVYDGIRMMSDLPFLAYVDDISQVKPVALVQASKWLMEK